MTSKGDKGIATRISNYNIAMSLGIFFPELTMIAQYNLYYTTFLSVMCDT